MYQPNRPLLAISLVISLSLLSACSSEDKEAIGEKATEAATETVETITAAVGKVDVAEAAAPATEAVATEAAAPAAEAVAAEAAAPAAEAVAAEAAAPAAEAVAAEAAAPAAEAVAAEAAAPAAEAVATEAAAPATEAVAAEAAAPAAEAVAAEAAAPATEAVAAEAAAPAEQTAANSSGQDHAKGKEVFDGGCFACHTTGVAGAPKLGDSAEWAKRLEKGKDVLYTHAIKGFMGVGMMPPKGGNTSLSDDDVKAAVDYMSAAQ